MLCNRFIVAGQNLYLHGALGRPSLSPNRAVVTPAEDLKEL